jgi:hypothetical protein
LLCCIGVMHCARAANEGDTEVQYVVAAMLACLLIACAAPAPVRGATCSTKYECEIEMYQKAR